MKAIAGALLGLVFLVGCKKNPTGELTLSGELLDARTGGPVADVEASLEEQVVEGGVWVGNWQSAGISESDATGQYEVAFQRTNALKYQVQFSKPLWFTEADSLDPNRWRGSETSAFNRTMTPKAWVRLIMSNSQPFAPPPTVRFRFLHPMPEDHEVYPNTWSQFDSEVPQDPIDCLMEGDISLPYAVEVLRDGEWTSWVDSIEVPRFDTTALVIFY